MPRLKATWVVVMDSAHAHFYRLFSSESGPSMTRARAPLLSRANAFAREEKSDRPGRSFGAVRSAVRHALEPKHDYHKLAKQSFTRTVANAIEEARAVGKFESLVVAASKRTLGELRKLLGAPAQRTIVLEIAKDIVKVAPNELPVLITRELDNKRLFPEKRVVAPSGYRPSSAAGTEVRVLFRNLRSAEAVEKSIRNHAEKLRQRYPRIETCKATVQGSRAHHRKGKLYRVTVFLQAPGSTLTVDSSGSRGPGHENVFAAIREAFDAANRSLRDYMRKRAERSQRVSLQGEQAAL